MHACHKGDIAERAIVMGECDAEGISLESLLFETVSMLWKKCIGWRGEKMGEMVALCD